MSSSWPYRDLVDLEFFSQADRSTAPTDLQRRDRQIFLKSSTSNSPQKGPAPQSLLALWLKSRRTVYSESEPSPGTLFASTLTVLQILLIIVGICSGVSAGIAFFSYSGTTPVNVLHFLVFFVASQVLLLLAFAAGSLMRLFAPHDAHLPIIARLLVEFVQKKLNKTATRIASQVGAQEKQQIMAVFGQSRGIFALHEQLFSWLFIRIVQLLSLFFNLALLTTSLLKITISDLAFGWQSTLQISAEQLYNLVHTLALPWSWLFPAGIGHPTLEQIAGSHIVLKDGLHLLSTTNLVSWWPFLLLCLICYGLIPRCALFIFCFLQEEKLKSRHMMRSPAVTQIVRRMQTPTLSSQADPTQLHTAPIACESEPAIHHDNAVPEQKNPLLVLFPEELSGHLHEKELADLFSNEGFELLDTRPLTLGFAQKSELISAISQFANQTPSGSLCILAESWMPPILSFLLFIQELRRTVGSGHLIEIRLLGKPSGSTPLTPVHNETMVTVWQQKIDSLADANIRLAPLLKG